MSELRDKTRQIYLERVNAVLEYIDQNLHSPLHLETLSKVAGFSPYHFHRIFQAMIGESAQSYIKKVRLNAAAYQLLYSPERTITEISMDCGFSSPSDFARSFKAYYQISPSKFIQLKSTNTILHPEGDGTICPVRLEKYPALTFNEPLDIRLRELPDLHVAYIRNTGLSKNFQSIQIEKAYHRLFQWSKAHHFITPETLFLGITLDSPEFTALEKCRYDACITVPEGIHLEGEIRTRLVSSQGEYATYRFRRQDPEFPRTFFEISSFMYGSWLPDHGFLPDDRPFLEFYLTETVTREVVMDFCIPVKPL